MEEKKPIYERQVWSVFEKIANEIRSVKNHLEEIEKIATEYVLSDKENAVECQRKG